MIKFEVEIIKLLHIHLNMHLCNRKIHITVDDIYYTYTYLYVCICISVCIVYVNKYIQL